MGNENLLLGLGAATVAYMAGASKYAGWDDFIGKFQSRSSLIKNFNVIPPYGLFHVAKNTYTIYREGVYSYLMGLPNCCTPSIIRILEIALREKYKNSENKETDMKLVNLIEWFEMHLKDKVHVVHTFRLLRNTILHTDNLVTETNALDTIRYVTEVVNVLYPFTSATLSTTCNSCKSQGTTSIYISNYFIGNVIKMECGRCQNKYDMSILV